MAKVSLSQTNGSLDTYVIGSGVWVALAPVTGLQEYAYPELLGYFPTYGYNPPPSQNWELYRAQTFTPANTHAVVKVILKLKRVGASLGDVIVRIEETGEDGLPNGNVLASKTFDAGLIPTETTDYEIAFDSPPTVQSGIMYAVILQYPDGDPTTNYIDWGYGNSVYDGGYLCYWYGGDRRWHGYGAWDLWFEEWAS